MNDDQNDCVLLRCMQSWLCECVFNSFLRHRTMSLLYSVMLPYVCRCQVIDHSPVKEVLLNTEGCIHSELFFNVNRP